MKKMKIPLWKLLGLPGPLHVYRNRPRLYRIWTNMRLRAKCPPCLQHRKEIKYYAHVTICDEWCEFPPFWFWAHLTGYRDDLTIDRIDWRKGYSPDNCRWATYSQQASNCHRDTEAYREAARRNGAKGNAVRWAKCKARS